MKGLAITILLVLGCLLGSFQQAIAQKAAYHIFDKEGKKTNYDSLLQMAEKADIVLFGELHNNPICHWLQFELTKDLHKLVGDSLIMGAEMFESDNQVILDEYLDGVISEKKFEDEIRAWPNYQTDYKPLINFAKTQELTFVASNIPRRYASLVYHKGIDKLADLSDLAKKWIAPLPIKIDLELPAYKNMLEMMQTSQHNKKSNAENFPKSQAVKDATMAHFILQNWLSGDVFLHYNGSYHSNNYEGIVHYLKQNTPELDILTISTVEQTNVTELEEESHNIADFIICIPESMTKTH